ncbi:hypothetical protein BBJ28_00010119 [Nothophytophthora sp. Chile5]|nr:hypothetical protein BBJ28_00010119 [Nothophytophthora sp. Chile5]
MSADSKTVLITGATRGIGLTFVEYYLNAGGKVVSTARNLDGAFVPLKKSYYDNTTLPNGHMYSYRASKCALNMINSCLAVDLKSDNIIAIVLQPGYVNTEPTYGNGVVQPVNSVAGMTKVIASVTTDDTAKFFDFQAPELPW